MFTLLVTCIFSILQSDIASTKQQLTAALAESDSVKTHLEESQASSQQRHKEEVYKLQSELEGSQQELQLSQDSIKQHREEIEQLQSVHKAENIEYSQQLKSQTESLNSTKADFEAQLAAAKKTTEDKQFELEEQLMFTKSEFSTVREGLEAEKAALEKKVLQVETESSASLQRNEKEIAKLHQSVSSESEERERLQTLSMMMFLYYLSY